MQFYQKKNGAMGIKYGSTHITHEQAMNVFVAGLYAFAINTPLNRFITINIPQKEDTKKIKKTIMDSSKKWLNLRDIPFSCIWCYEIGNINGFHVHMLLYVPSGYMNKYKKHITGVLTNKGIDCTQYHNKDMRMLDFRNISYDAFYTDTIINLENLLNVLKYMCKGIAEPKSSDHEFLQQIYDRYAGKNNQGLIYTQRIGLSRNLNYSYRSTQLACNSLLQQKLNCLLASDFDSNVYLVDTTIH